MTKQIISMALYALSLAGCAHRAPPAAGNATRPPDMTGATVMMLPAQPGPGALAKEPVPGLDREIAFALGERLPGVKWVFPPAMERALARSPGLEIDLHALAVSAFRRAQVKNIGDPLFGDLHSLGVLLGARFALLPVAAWYAPGDTAAGHVGDEPCPHRDRWRPRSLVRRRRRQARGRRLPRRRRHGRQCAGGRHRGEVSRAESAFRRASRRCDSLIEAI